MYAKHLTDLVVNYKEKLGIVAWKMQKRLGLPSVLGQTFCVVDNDDKFIGIVTPSSFPIYEEADDNITVGDICNRNCKFLEDDKNLFLLAKEIFEENSKINMIPVLDAEKNIIDVIFPFQVFYKNYFLPSVSSAMTKPDVYRDFANHRITYAYSLWCAANQAKNLGYDKISAIEFGVASGEGLIAMEWHARAMERFFGISIDVYGFDSGDGLPESQIYKDAPYLWPVGTFMQQDIKKRMQRFLKAKFVLGDVKDTAKTFIDEYKPAPIGVISVDVDLYSSTVPILEMLKNNDEHFLPRVMMYFDDILWDSSFNGELLAVKEFNQATETMKIAPESLYESTNNFPLRVYDNYHKGHHMFNNIKINHRFNHPKYNCTSLY